MSLGPLRAMEEGHGARSQAMPMPRFPPATAQLALVGAVRGRGAEEEADAGGGGGDELGLVRQRGGEGRH